MVRLYNHTRYSDAVLRDVLNWAARVAGVQGDVPVKLTYCTHIRGCGTARNGYPYLKTLEGRPSDTSRRTLNCESGWIHLRIPRKSATAPHNERDGDRYLTAAEWFVDMAVHEMSHIRQYRVDALGYMRRGPEFFGRREGKKRMAHDRRPCELDAQNTVDELRDNRAKDKRRQDLAIALAIELEEKGKHTQQCHTK